MATVTMYGRPDCEDTERAREFLREHGVGFDEVNIDEDQEGQEFVLLVNSGARITPTLVIGPDENKTILTEPSNEELARGLVQHGYKDSRPALDEDGIPNRTPPRHGMDEESFGG